MQVQLGDIKLTSIVEQPLEDIEELIPGATPDVIEATPWLKPHFVDSQGVLTGLVQAFVVETPGNKIIVDTCVGNEKNFSLVEHWNNLHYPFIERLNEAGYHPDDIDTVLCTHLHLDHIGWNTYKENGEWKPTFRNADYLIARVEFEALMQMVEADVGTIELPEGAGLGDLSPEEAVVAWSIISKEAYSDSIKPLFDAGLVRLVDTDHRVCAGVELVPTHGHSPGHVSVMIESEGKAAMITGDAIHHPVQIARPELWTLADASPEDAVAMRQNILSQASRDQRLLVGTHFSEPTAGYVVTDGDGYRFDLDKE